MGVEERPAQHGFEPGSLFAGHRIERLVGRGGMGVVYRAREPRLDRVVALKVIAPHLLDDSRARGRFVHEARAAASIDHPNVIPVHYAGEHDGVAYIAMRYVDGDDLRTLIRRDGPLPAARAVAITRQVAAALDAIHASGLVHRDVKPGNVLLGLDEHVYLTDFGLAKSIVALAPSTQAGHWVGTLDFVAPEQIRGNPVDARTDVYALGGVLYFALTGAPPFRRDTDDAKLWAHLSAPPPRPSEVVPGLPAGFDDVVGRAMAKDPADRYPSAGDLGRAALAALEGRPVDEPERVVARGAAAPDIAGTRAPDESTVSATRPGPPDDTPTTRLPSRRRIRTPVAAAAVIATAGAALFAFLSGGDDPSSPIAPASTDAPKSAGEDAGTSRTFEHVGERPNAIAVAGGNVWVASFRRTRLIRIDAKTGDRAQGPVVRRGVSDLVASGRMLWAANARSRQVLGMDSRTGHVLVRLYPPGAPSGLTVDGPDRLWVVLRTPVADGPDVLLRYDLPDRRPTLTTELGAGTSAVVVMPGALWITPRRRSAIWRLDPETGIANRWIQVPSAAGSMTAGGGYLWVPQREEGYVLRIDPTTGRKRRTAVRGIPTSVAVAKGKVYVSCPAADAVAVLDARTGRPVGKPRPVGDEPYALASGAGHLWVANAGSNSVTRLDY